MIRSTLFMALALACATPQVATAAEIEVNYRGVLTYTYGPQAASFTAGQEVNIRYVVESTAVDNDPNPKTGSFANGLLRLEISVPAANLDTEAENGRVVVFNDANAGDSDQAHFIIEATRRGQLAGLPITRSSVSFHDWSAEMLVSDSLPTHALPAIGNSFGFVTLWTSAGWTRFDFIVEEVSPPNPTCTSEGYIGAKLTWCQNICENGLTGQVLDTWIHRWISRYRALPYCAAKD